MHILKNFLRIVIFISPLNVICQNISGQELKWMTSNTIDNTSQEEIVGKTYFITHSSTIDWIQNEGKLKRTFKIDGVKGTWDDINQNGELIYSVSRMDLSGTITFKKSSERTTIEMVITRSKVTEWSFHFTVESVTLN